MLKLDIKINYNWIKKVFCAGQSFYFRGDRVRCVTKNLVCQFNLIDGGYCHNLILSFGRKGSHHLHFSSVFQRKYPVSIAYTEKNDFLYRELWKKFLYWNTHWNIYLWWNIFVKQAFSNCETDIFFDIFMSHHSYPV